MKKSPTSLFLHNNNNNNNNQYDSHQNGECAQDSADEKSGVASTCKYAYNLRGETEVNVSMKNATTVERKARRIHLIHTR